MTERAEVSSETIARLRQMCAGLPEAYEEAAWVGTRWRIRKHTFAHVLTIDAGWPPVYAATVGCDGPMTVLTFQSAGPELEALTNAGPPYFRPRWRPGIVGMILDDVVDWSEVSELVTESYCQLAPRKLAGLVARPPDSTAMH